MFQALLHVSSAYVNSHLTNAEEKIYPVPETAEKVIEIASTVSDADLEEVTEKYVPNLVCII